MTNKKILVTLEVDDKQQQDFRDQVNEFSFKRYDELNVDDVTAADIIIGNVPLKMLEHVRHLEYLHLYMAGSDQFAAHPQIKNKVLLTNSSGCFGLGISEHMLGSVLYFYKRFHQYQRNQQQHRWQSQGEIRSIAGSRVLVIGLGDIGSCFAQRMAALQAQVTGIKRTAGVKPAYLENLYQLDKLDACLSEADIIACSLPNSQETYHLINRERLALMKKDAVFINVGRGSAVDTTALYDALSTNPDMSAALDVFEQEPLPADSLLWNLENVQITPHVSGGRNLAITRQKLFELAKHNLSAYLNQQPLTNVVDYQTGYRTSK